MTTAVPEPAAPMAAAARPAAGKALLRSLAGGLLTAVPIVVIGLLILEFAPAYLVRITFAAYVNLLIVLGLQIFMGNSMVANLGQGAFVGIGAYTVAILATPIAMKKMSIPNAPFGLSHVAIDPLLAAGAGLGIAGIVAFLTGIVVARVSGEAATILTFSLLMIVHSVFIHWTDLFKGAQAFFGIPQVVNLQIAVALSVVGIVLARLFKDSRVGLQLRASAESLLAARAFGVDVVRLRLIAWVVGAMFCATGGVLYAYFMGTINARAFHFELVLTTLAMLILGGLRTVSGAVFGCVLLSTVLEVIRTLENGVTIGNWQTPPLLGLSGLAMGGVIVFSMIFRPKGMISRLEFDELLRQWFGRRTSVEAASGSQGDPGDQNDASKAR
ncbi:branched-chain amino acid ABC transporter permease [Hypericibacter terrae]|jgi:branched-chain amino acid transport system permease protein|uniref:Branched-chain amino acid ABC transporter permease n=1 Tax=Hypericibacter terrae TaxID=2602015 RepID=A0A5J6MKY8_9PROT|nr:branched-chain amino acid ABC transporter permease [Hypericibacter terrae]QEX18178.1 branched-chain amino acid ABC transporter permease [Hypericibacter terrae]